MALFPLVGGVGGKISDFGAQLIGKGLGLGKKTPMQSTPDYNKQLQATHAESVAKFSKPSPSSVDVVSPKTAKAMAPVAKAVPKPPPAPSAPASPAAPGTPGGQDPASVVPGPTSGGTPAVPGASAPGPAAPTYADQLKAAQDAYLGSLAPSPEATAAQEQLGSVSSQAAADVAAKQKEYADRLQAIQEQATLQPFLTGREQQAQQQLTSQLAAIQAGSQAQTVPLQEKLAQFQAQQQAKQQQAQAALGFAQPKTATVGAGEAVIDPATGQVIYQAPAKPSATPASLQEYEFAKSQGFTGSFLDFQKAQNAASASASPDRVLSASEAQALGVPFGTTASQAYGLSPKKPLTETQQKDITFGNRAAQANTYIDDLGPKITTMNPASFAAQVAAEPNPIGNAFVSPEIRQLRQAERNFETAVLRRESGAAISASEFATDEKKYFPRPGDDEKTLQQKAEARQTAIQTMLQAGQQGTGDSFKAPDGTEYEQGSDGLYYPKAVSGTGKPVAAQAVDIAEAIKKVESGGNYEARGASGEYGAYQFLPSTWRGWAQKYLGDANAPMTPENQDRVAQEHIGSLLAQGKTPEEIALIWNGGQPVRKKGVNKMGVRFDSGAYADKVLKELNG